MSQPTAPHDVPVTGGATAGTLALVLGLAFAAATAYLYLLSLSPDVNPPTWARILGLVWLPVGLVGTPVAFALGRHGPGRARAVAGLGMLLVGIAAFVALMFAAG